MRLLYSCSAHHHHRHHATDLPLVRMMATGVATGVGGPLEYYNREVSRGNPMPWTIWKKRWRSSLVAALTISRRSLIQLDLWAGDERFPFLTIPTTKTTIHPEGSRTRPRAVGRRLVAHLLRTIRIVIRRIRALPRGHGGGKMTTTLATSVISPPRGSTAADALLPRTAAVAPATTSRRRRVVTVALLPASGGNPSRTGGPATSLPT